MKIGRLAVIANAFSILYLFVGQLCLKTNGSRVNDIDCHAGRRPAEQSRHMNYISMVLLLPLSSSSTAIAIDNASRILGTERSHFHVPYAVTPGVISRIGSLSIGCFSYLH